MNLAKSSQLVANPIHSIKNNTIFSKWRALARYLGPAFIVSVAYIDPGNFATNISGGSIFNYNLVWVILWSNLMAIFCQTMSAKLGIATGHNLPEMCAKIFSKKTNWFFWIAAELAAIMTDLAEFLGGTLGLYLLFRIPMVYAGLINRSNNLFDCIFGKIRPAGSRSSYWVPGGSHFNCICHRVVSGKTGLGPNRMAYIDSVVTKRASGNDCSRNAWGNSYATCNLPSFPTGSMP